jgi:hypothetical protein
LIAIPTIVALKKNEMNEGRRRILLDVAQTDLLRVQAPHPEVDADQKEHDTAVPTDDQTSEERPGAREQNSDDNSQQQRDPYAWILPKNP